MSKNRYPEAEHYITKFETDSDVAVEELVEDQNLMSIVEYLLHQVSDLRDKLAELSRGKTEP
jgi:hypothetical protein